MTHLLNSSPDSLQYGGDVFRTASSFLSRAVPGPAEAGPPPESVHPVTGLTATLLLLWRLPRVSVSLSDSPAGRRLRRHFDHRMWGVRHSRIAQGVQVLPRQQARYLRGRSRQALRTNIRRARAEGITCRSLEQLGERRTAALHLRRRMPEVCEWSDDLFRMPGDVWWAACDRRGRTVALAHVTVDRECALLQSFVSSHRASRYMLHAALVDMLVARDVRYLVVSGPMAPLLDPSLQYWQRLLGFDVAHVVVKRVRVAPSASAIRASADPVSAVTQAGGATGALARPVP